MYTFSMDGKRISVFPATGPDAPVIYLNTVSDEGRMPALYPGGHQRFGLGP